MNLSNCLTSLLAFIWLSSFSGASLECTFKDGFCDWKQTVKQCSWILAPSCPPMVHNCIYVTDNSGSNCSSVGLRADIGIPGIRGICFEYFMNGVGGGSLQVKDNSGKTLWSSLHQPERRWRPVQVFLSHKENVKAIILEANFKSDSSAFIAVANILEVDEFKVDTPCYRHAADTTIVEIITSSLSTTQDISASSSTTQDISASSSTMQDILDNSSTTQDISASSSTMQDILDNSSTTQDISDSSSTRQDISDSSSTTQDISASSSTMQDILDNSSSMQDISDITSTTSLKTTAGSETTVRTTSDVSKTSLTEVYKPTHAQTEENQMTEIHSTIQTSSETDIYPPSPDQFVSVLPSPTPKMSDHMPASSLAAIITGVLCFIILSVIVTIVTVKRLKGKNSSRHVSTPLHINPLFTVE